MPICSIGGACNHSSYLFVLSFSYSMYKHAILCRLILRFEIRESCFFLWSLVSGLVMVGHGEQEYMEYKICPSVDAVVRAKNSALEGGPKAVVGPQGWEWWTTKLGVKPGEAKTNWNLWVQMEPTCGSPNSQLWGCGWPTGEVNVLCHKAYVCLARTPRSQRMRCSCGGSWRSHRGKHASSSSGQAQGHPVPCTHLQAQGLMLHSGVPPKWNFGIPDLELQGREFWYIS